MKSVQKAAAFAGAALALVLISGCTSRGMTVTSEPPGAEVSINRRVVGDSPIRVAFTHYGTYRIELRKRGYETLVREENVSPPIYGYDPVAAVADNLIPSRLNDDVYLHYVLKPQEYAGLKDDKEKANEKDGGGDDGKGGRKAAAAEDAHAIEAHMERDKASKEALLERAFAARNGAITHPKTHEQIQVAIGAETTRKEAKAADLDEPVHIAETYSVIGPDLAPNLALPSDLGPVPPIKAQAPARPTLAEELNIEPEQTGGATPASVDKPIAPAAAFSAPEPPKKAEPPRIVRTPKDEELIFDKPEIIDPARQKKK